MSASHTLKIPDAVKDILSECTRDGLILRLPDRQLDRKMYLDVKKILEAAGGKWSTPKKGFVFTSAADVDKAVGAADGGEIVREKVVRQAFYTPAVAADDLVDFAGSSWMKARPLILEPSCGAGALIHAVLNRAPLAYVHGYETDMATAGECAERFKGSEVTVTVADFLTIKPFPKYDAVLMNPPFQRGQAAKHVEHAWKFLRKGGVLAAIVPSNFIWPYPHARDERPIPAGAFKESGTMVATKMIRAVKP
jgi:predicted RNA methylase